MTKIVPQLPVSSTMSTLPSKQASPESDASPALPHSDLTVKLAAQERGKAMNLFRQLPPAKVSGKLTEQLKEIGVTVGRPRPLTVSDALSLFCIGSKAVRQVVGSLIEDGTIPGNTKLGRTTVGQEYADFKHRQPAVRFGNMFDS